MSLNTELSTVGAAQTTYLIFSLDNALYALPALAVREIIWLPAVTPLEETPPYIIGGINLRGKVIPIMDLNLRLGRPAPLYRTQDSIVVLEQNGELLGVIVNEVRNVRQIAAEQVEAAPFAASSIAGSYGRSAEDSDSVVQNRCLAGVVRVKENIVMLLHLENLLGLPDNLTVDQVEQWPLLDTERLFQSQATPADREIFRERARSLMQPLASDDLVGLSPVAVVALNGEYFGIDLNIVREFSSIRHVTPVPCCPEHIIGQMNLRGDIITLVDIRGTLQMPMHDITADSQVIVVQADNLLVGVPVDEVLDVVYLRPGDILPVPTAVQAMGGDYLRGTAPHNDKMLGLLDLAKILTQDELVVYEEV